MVLYGFVLHAEVTVVVAALCVLGGVVEALAPRQASGDIGARRFAAGRSMPAVRTL